MLSRAATRQHVLKTSTSIPEIGLLPCLYCTSTILRRYITSDHGSSLQSTQSPAETEPSIPPQKDYRYVKPMRRRSTQQWSDPASAHRSDERRKQAMDRHVQRAREWPDRKKPTAGSIKRGDGGSPSFPRRKPDKHHVKRFADIEGTTITPNEAKAFEGLLRLPEKEGNEEEDGTQSKPGVEGATNREVVARDTSHFSPALRRMADKAREEREKRFERRIGRKHLRTREEYRASLRPLEVVMSAAQKEVYEVNGEMAKASTDVEVWQILWDRVLKRVKTLTDATVEAEQKPKKPNPKKKKKKKQEIVGLEHQTDESTEVQAPPTSLPLLTQTLPNHLTKTFTLLRTTYPSSPLSLAILPTLKSLGPRAFALGASTSLYNMQMHRLYREYRDLDGIVRVLQEMEREVHDFNEGTLQTLFLIVSEGHRARRGRMVGRDRGRRLQTVPVDDGDDGDRAAGHDGGGPVLRSLGSSSSSSSPVSAGKALWTGSNVLWGTRRQRRGIEELREWVNAVRARIEDKAVRKARDYENWRYGVEEWDAGKEERRVEREVEAEARGREWAEDKGVEMEREGLIEDILNEGGREKGRRLRA